MKHYKEDFYVSEQINKNTAVRVKPEFFDSRTSAEQKEIMLDSWYDVGSSKLVINEEGTVKTWSLINLDKNRYHPCWKNLIDIVSIERNFIDDTEYPFLPEYYEFEAPEIGEQFYLWVDGKVYNVTVSEIRIYLRPEGSYWCRIKFQEKDSGLSHILVGNDIKDVLELISKYCRKEVNGFDNDFWHDRYEELRARKDAEYDELYDEYERYREWD